MTSVPALSLRGLTKRYDGGLLALDGFDLEIADGEFFGLLGPNGAGKTTLISAVCNLIRITSGEIEIFGRAPPRPGGAADDGPRRAGRQPRPLPRRGGDARLPRRLLRDEPPARGAPRAGDDGRLRPAREGRGPGAEPLGRDAAPAAAGARADARAAAGHPRRADGRASTSSCASSCGATSGGCTSRARRSCSPPITWRRPRSSVRTSRSSAAVACWRATARPACWRASRPTPWPTCT